nr:FMN-binding negative transcriptional regulator [Allomuricauda sp.]
MYIPHYYKNENLGEIKDFLQHNSFGILVNQVDGKPWATHLPLELWTAPDGKEYLEGHVAKANPQWRAFKEGSEVLCIFNGPHAYVSSSWYQEEEVPTWNYIAVHIYGKLHILDEAATMESLHRLVDKYEQGSKNPLSMNDLSAKTLRQVKGVVGFQIEIKDIQAAYKLSQGRPHDHAQIIKELREKDTPGSSAIAQEMDLL